MLDESRFTEKPYGYSEYLEILTSIISGYNQPLKTDHLQLFEHCLMPLHRHRFISHFRPNLVKAVSTFINKDESLSCLAILTCLKYWSLVNSSNEVACLSEVETYLNLLKSTSHLNDICVSLIKRVSLCACSLNWEVSERALYLLHNPVLLQLLK
jgi:hypothetical protein